MYKIKEGYTVEPARKVNQVSMDQYLALVERVEKLEAILTDKMDDDLDSLVSEPKRRGRRPNNQQEL